MRGLCMNVYDKRNSMNVYDKRYDYVYLCTQVARVSPFFGKIIDFSPYV